MSYQIDYGSRTYVTVLLAAAAFAILAFGFVAFRSVASPHDNAVHGCLHASTDAPTGSEQFERSALACEAQVSAREQAARP